MDHWALQHLPDEQLAHASDGLLYKLLASHPKIDSKRANMKEAICHTRGARIVEGLAMPILHPSVRGNEHNPLSMSNTTTRRLRHL